MVEHRQVAAALKREMDEYRRANPRSVALSRRAQAVLPGGTTAPHTFHPSLLFRRGEKDVISSTWTAPPYLCFTADDAGARVARML